MRRALLLTLALAGGCASTLQPAPHPPSGPELIVAYQASQGAPSLAILEGKYPYVNRLPRVASHVQETVIDSSASEVEVLRAKAQAEAIDLSAVVVPRLSPAPPAVLEALRPLVIGPESSLPAELCESLRATFKADALLLGRVQTYASEWQELNRRLRTGQGFFEYKLRFGVGLEQTLYDLKTGRPIDSWVGREGDELQRPRRLPPSPSTIGYSSDDVLNARVFELARQLAERAAARYQPRID